MPKVKWRDAVFEDIIERAATLGWQAFDEDKVNKLIDDSAKREPDSNGFPQKLQKAYIRAASFTELGRKRFLNALRDGWPTKPQKRKHFKKDHVAEARWIDPNCRACHGTGLNTNDRQCMPCIKNGAKVRTRPKAKKKPEGGERNRNASSAAAPPKPPLPPSKAKMKPKPPPPPPPRTKKAPPPPPPKRRPPPPPPPKAKAKEETPGQPQAPSKMGKTYGKAAKTPPRSRATTFFAVCIQVRLVDSSYDETVVGEELNRYVVGETGFGATVPLAKQLGPHVFDLRVHYMIHPTEVFDLIEQHDWVEKAQTRPVQDMDGPGDILV